MKVTWRERVGWPSAGQVLAVASAVPALALTGWLLAGVPLLLIGWFGPVQMILLGVGLAFLLGRYGLRRMPETVEATARQTAALLGVAAASGIFNGLLHGEQFIVRRDPATYAQYAVWLAVDGTLPIPADVAAFGGPDPALRFDSVGFYGVGPDGAVLGDDAVQGPGTGILPQFMPGTAIIHAFGHWMGGVPGLMLMPPILGALAVLTFGGTVARLAGARWAVVAAAVLAVSLPVIYTSRAAFSETCSMILLFGAVSLLLDARHRLRAGLLGVGFLPAASAPLPEDDRRRWPARRDDAAGEGEERAGAGLMRALAAARAVQAGDAAVVAALAGLLFGLALLIRVDVLRDVLPVLGYAGLLIALHRYRRRGGGRVPHASDGRLGWPLLGGLAAGAGIGFVAAYALARPYLADLSDSLRPLLGIAAVVVALTALGAAFAPRLGGLVARLVRRPPPGVARWWPALAAGLVVAGVAALAVRPWAQTVRRVATTPEDLLTADFIAKVQAANGLPVDSTRLYYEDSLYWVIWYVGVPVTVSATLAAAVLTHRLARGREFVWLLPLAVVMWTTATTLLRPGITPDHPFASRRLVPIVIPGLILLAVWGLRLLRDRARRAGHDRLRQNALVTAGVLLLLAPGAVTSIGTAFTPVGRGEAAAVARLCGAMPRDGSVLIVERVTGDRFTQLVRGMCGLPAARVAVAPGADLAAPSDVARLIARVRAAGRTPVLLAAEDRQLVRYGTPALALSLRTRQDERSLVSPPDGTWTLAVDVWMALPAAS